MEDAGSVIIGQFAMNLKETIISSSFGHLILFLLMIAAMSYTTGPSWNGQKVMPVDLLSQTTDEEPPVLNPSSDKEDMEEQAVTEAPEAMEEQPAGEAEAETVATQEKAVIQEVPSIQREGFSSPEAYHQFIMIHKQIFRRKAEVKTNELVAGALRFNTRHFYGGNAFVSLRFSPDGSLGDIRVDSDSEDLKAFLEGINWGFIPAPSAYSLGNAGVLIEVAVGEGFMNFRITVQ